MKRFLAPIVVALVLVVAAGSSSLAGEPEYRVVVHASRGIKTISQADLGDCFTRRKLEWADGVRVTPLDLTVLSDVRRSFTKDVFGGSVNSVMAYWEKEISMGRRHPPSVKASDEEVIAFVQSNEGAVGYVSSKTVLPAGLNALTVVRTESRAAVASLAGSPAPALVARVP
jgi:ABC-type phosphate transport system substrate-binding protein